MRILIGTTEISGLAADLCKSLCLAGEHARLVLRHPHRFAYATERPNALVRVWHRLHQTGGLGLVGRALARGARWCWSLLVLGWAIRRFDTFLYLFGVGVTNSPLEFKLLRLLGKRVIVFYVGSDERPPFMDGAVCLGDPAPSIEQLRKLILAKKRRILQCEKYASLCIGSPFSGQFHERSFVKCFSLGIPRHIDAPVQTMPMAEKAVTVRILHAPSQLAAKGSKVIEEIIRDLSAEGLLIEYVRLENASNEQVLREIELCDFVVDQLYSDTPMSAFPTEAAYLGKPAVVGGYLAEQLNRFLPADDIPPTLFVRPEQLQDAIRRLVVDAGYRRHLGHQAQEFVRSRWSSEEVARRYMLLFRDQIPAEWWFDPRQIEYFHGFGLPSQRLGQLVHQLHKLYGRESLCLTDKPELEGRLLALAQQVGEGAGATTRPA